MSFNAFDQVVGAGTGLGAGFPAAGRSAPVTTQPNYGNYGMYSDLWRSMDNRYSAAYRPNRDLSKSFGFGPGLAAYYQQHPEMVPLDLRIMGYGSSVNPPGKVDLNRPPQGVRPAPATSVATPGLGSGFDPQTQGLSRYGVMPPTQLDPQGRSLGAVAGGNGLAIIGYRTNGQPVYATAATPSIPSPDRYADRGTLGKYAAIRTRPTNPVTRTGKLR